MTVIVSVVNLTTLGWVISQSTGFKIAAKLVVCADEAMAAALQMLQQSKTSQFFQKVDCI